MRLIKYIFNVVRYSINGFFKDQCFLHASSLTFYTLLSLVPLLAVAFGLAKGFGFENTLKSELYQRFSEHEAILQLVVEFSQSLLLQVEGSLITGVGAIFLFLFVMSLFWTVETSMNIIWKVKRSRRPLRMLTDYFAMTIIFPFIFALASSSMVYVTTVLHRAALEHELLQRASPYFFMFYRGLALVTIWLLFTALYVIMPNKKVDWKYGMIAGVLAGTAYYFIQAMMITFQIGVSQYSAVYGSFAALPIFLLWLQISWVTVLMGAQIAYHLEHLAPALSRKFQTLRISKNQLGVLLILRIIDRFKYIHEPYSEHELAYELGVSGAVTEDLLTDLSEAGLLREVKSGKAGRYFQPGINVRNISLQSIHRAIDHNLREMFEINAVDDAIAVQTAMKVFENAKNESPANAIVEDLVT
jgi:membrane protein